MPRTLTLVVAGVLATDLLAGCGDDDDERVAPTKMAVTATDHRFDPPATITGGTVELSFTNRGKEAHFAGFARGGVGQDLRQRQLFCTIPSPDGTPHAAKAWSRG